MFKKWFILVIVHNNFIVSKIKKKWKKTTIICNELFLINQILILERALSYFKVLKINFYSMFLHDLK